MLKRWYLVPAVLLAAMAVIQIAADKPAPPAIQPAPLPPGPCPIACDELPACCVGVACFPPVCEMNIQVDLRLMHVSEACFNQLGLKFNGDAKQRHAFVGAKGLPSLLETAQKDRSTNVICMPRLTVLNGQTATIQCATKAVERVGIDFECKDCTAQTKVQKVEHGWRVDLISAASADKKSVTLKLDCQHSELPSSKVVQATCCDSKPNQTCVASICSSSFTVPSGQSVVIDAGKATCGEGCAVPVLTIIPYVNRLFRPAPVQSHLLLIATPTIHCGDHAAEGKCPGKCCDKECGCCAKCCKPKAVFSAEAGCAPQCVKPAGFAAIAPPTATRAMPQAKMSPVEERAAKMAQKLVEKYAQALERGEPEKARKYARQALDLDPAVFSKVTLNVYSDNPNVRMKQLIDQSEEWRQTKGEWQKFWFNDAPSHLTPQRTHGGIQ